MQPSLIPSEHRAELSMAIARGEVNEAKRLIEQFSLNVNAYLDGDFRVSVLIEALNAYNRKLDNTRLDFLKWLLKRGANPSLNCNSGYNCLHMALRQANLVDALMAFLDVHPEVNVKDSNGANALYWAIQSFPWKMEGEERAKHLQVIQQIMALGGDLDMANQHGVTPRTWLDRTAEDVKALVNQCEAAGPQERPVPAEQAEFPSNLAYPEIAQKIWNESVPASGVSDNVQGELLRSVERLRDEAQRNGNINYDKEHKGMAVFIRDTLLGSKLFDQPVSEKIRQYSAQLLKEEYPYLEDDIYDYLTDRICEFYLTNPEPIALKTRARRFKWLFSS